MFQNLYNKTKRFEFLIFNFRLVMLKNKVYAKIPKCRPMRLLSRELLPSRPQDPHGGTKEQTSPSCHLTCACTPTYRNTQKKQNVIRILDKLPKAKKLNTSRPEHF